MVDNTQLNNATSEGDIIAADDVDGIKYQRVKISIGPDGEATDLSFSQPLPLAEPQALTALLTELQLLNTRFEEAFRTGIKQGDIRDEN